MKYVLILGVVGIGGFFLWRNMQKPVTQGGRAPSPQPSANVPASVGRGQSLCEKGVQIGAQAAGASYGVPPNVSGQGGAMAGPALCNMGEALAKGAYKGVKVGAKATVKGVTVAAKSTKNFAKKVIPGW